MTLPAPSPSVRHLFSGCKAVLLRPFGPSQPKACAAPTRHRQAQPERGFALNCIFSGWRAALLAALLLGASSLAQAAVSVNLKYALRGATLRTAKNLPMTTDLRSWDVIPYTDPYGGTVTLAAGTMPLNTVDWVYVDLYSGATAATCSAAFARPALLLDDGSIVDPTTLTAPLNFANAPPGNYNIRIRHRNHATLISTPQALGVAAGAPVDLTQPVNLVNPTNAETQNFGVAAKVGDANQDGVINAYPVTPGSDMETVSTAAGLGLFFVYDSVDIDMDSFVDSQDVSAIFNQVVLLGSVPASPDFPATGGAACGVGVPVVAGPLAAIPTLSPALLAALSALMGLTGAGMRWRKRHPR